MKYDSENRGLELVIRTGGYRIVLDVPNRTVRLAKMNQISGWNICLRCRDKAGAAG